MNIECLDLYGYKINVVKPLNYTSLNNYNALILNDGHLIYDLNLGMENFFIFAIEPKDRSKEYSPWMARSIFDKSEVFDGNCRQYNDFLIDKIIPNLIKTYGLNNPKIAYGGYSLGALAAIYSLFFTDRFDIVFSICASLWYPNLYQFLMENPIVNKNVDLFLLNGLKEINVKNKKIAGNFKDYENIHRFFKDNIEFANCKFDDYGHMGRLYERFCEVFNWIDDIK